MLRVPSILRCDPSEDFVRPAFQYTRLGHRARGHRIVEKQVLAPLQLPWNKSGQFTRSRNGIRKFSWVKTNVSKPLIQGGLAMENRILIGCDLHDKTMLLKYARGREAALKRCFENTVDGRKAMTEMLLKFAGGAKVVFAY